MKTCVPAKGCFAGKMDTVCFAGRMDTVPPCRQEPDNE